jgi:hypothetical protein
MAGWDCAHALDLSGPRAYVPHVAMGGTMSLEQAKQDFEQARTQAMRKRFEILGTFVAAMAGAVGVVIALSSFFSARSASKEADLIEAQIHSATEISSLQQRVAQLQATVHDSQVLIGKLESSPPATTQIAKVSAQLDSLQTQVKVLEDAIQQSPEKTLAVPLLKKDMDNLKDSYHHDLDNTQAEINRVYDQNKWFIGLMFTMALGLLGLAVSNFLQLRKP